MARCRGLLRGRAGPAQQLLSGPTWSRKESHSQRSAFRKRFGSSCRMLPPRPPANSNGSTINCSSCMAIVCGVHLRLIDHMHVQLQKRLVYQRPLSPVYHDACSHSCLHVAEQSLAGLPPPLLQGLLVARRLSQFTCCEGFALLAPPRTLQTTYLSISP